MEKFVWTSHYSVSVEAMDTQHQQIIDMINLLVADPDATVRSVTVSELLGKLTVYSSQHFQNEEQLLSEHGYPDLAGQKEEHKEYRQKVAKFCIETMNHEGSVPTGLLEFLMNWWKDHILVSDMKYRSFFEDLGVK